jgi:hypothetical protein
MGTRNLTKVIDADGVIKVAQYGQWDGYPSGQGVTALYHAHNAKMIEAGLKRCRFGTEEEFEAIYATLPQMNYLGTEDSNNFDLLYPNLTRNTGADILGVVAYSVGEVILADQSDFEQDELFCEGVYTIDFQRNKFISNFGKVVEFDLDNLPTKEEYLESFA